MPVPPAYRPPPDAAVLAARNCCRMPIVSLRMLFTSAQGRGGTNVSSQACREFVLNRPDQHNTQLPAAWQHAHWHQGASSLQALT